MALLDLSLRDGVASLTLDRPQARNALSVDVCSAIVSALDDVDARDDVRVVLVRGAGPAFCAGADFAAVSGPEAAGFLTVFEDMLDALARHRLPTIAAIHGAAMGGGLQLAGVCDFRIAASNAKLGIPSSRLGIVVNYENVQRLVHLVGVTTAKEVLMTARTFSGAEAAAAGLVDRCVPPESLDEEVDALASRLASLAPLAVQGAKRAIQVVLDAMSPERAEAGRVWEIDALVAQAYASRDLAEGLAAMREKRPPRFEGR